MKVYVEKFGQPAAEFLVSSGQTYAQVFEIVCAEDDFSGTFQKFVDGQPLSSVAAEDVEDGAKLTLVPKMESGI